MGTYVMLTRLSPEAVARPQSLTELNEQVESRIKADPLEAGGSCKKYNRLLFLDNRLLCYGFSHLCKLPVVPSA
mgnify:CR=1 FL=1